MLNNSSFQPGSVQVWDGKAFSMRSMSEAKKLVKAGTHEIATGKNALYLMTERDFKAAASSRAAKKRKTYKTREMKAES